MNRCEQIHIRCTKTEKAKLKVLANKTKRSMSNYILYKILYTQEVPKIIQYVEKKSMEKGIERIKQVERAKSPIPQNIPDDVRNIRKNLFKNKKVKDILKSDK